MKQTTIADCYCFPFPDLLLRLQFNSQQGGKRTLLEFLFQVPRQLFSVDLFEPTPAHVRQPTRPAARCNRSLHKSLRQGPCPRSGKRTFGRTVSNRKAPRQSMPGGSILVLLHFVPT